MFISSFTSRVPCLRYLLDNNEKSCSTMYSILIMAEFLRPKYILKNISFAFMHVNHIHSHDIHVVITKYQKVPTVNSTQ